MPELDLLRDSLFFVVAALVSPTTLRIAAIRLSVVDEFVVPSYVAEEKPEVASTTAVRCYRKNSTNRFFEQSFSLGSTDGLALTHRTCVIEFHHGLLITRLISLACYEYARKTKTSSHTRALVTF